MRIERQQPFRIFGVARGRGFPIDDAADAINFADGIYISQELASFWKRVQDFDLQIVLCKAFQQMDTMMHQAIPGLAFLLFESRTTVSTPFREECGTRVFPAKESAQGFFKGAAKKLWQREFTFLASHPNNDSGSYAGSANTG